MSPIKVVKNQDGSLHREAMKSLQLAKERRENRERKDRDKGDPRDAKKFNNIVANAGVSGHNMLGIGRANFVEQDKQNKKTMEVSSNMNNEQRKPHGQILARRPLKRTRREIKDQQKTLPIYHYKEDLI